MVSLTEFLAQIAMAGVHASVRAAEHSQGLFLGYFFEDANKTLRPKVVEIGVGKRVVDVPVVTLMPAAAMALHELTVEFQSDIDLQEKHQVKAKEGNPELTLSLRRGLLKRGTTVKVKARFKRTSEPESIEKIRDRLNSAIGVAINAG